MTLLFVRLTVASELSEYPKKVSSFERKELKFSPYSEKCRHAEELNQGDVLGVYIERFIPRHLVLYNRKGS